MFREQDPHEPPPPRNRDQELPAPPDETLGEREPLMPTPEPEHREPDTPRPLSS